MEERRKKTRVRRKNMGIRRVLLLLILVFIAIQLVKMIVPAAITFSRYVYAKVRTYYFSTQEFYFNSDRLTPGNAARFEMNNWSGGGRYPMLINIFTKKNTTEFTKEDVPYDIYYEFEVCDKNDVPYEDPSSLVEFYISKTEGEVKQSNSNKDYFEIAVTPIAELNNDDYIRIYLEVTSRSPYVEKLMGEIRIGISNLGMSYQIDDDQHSPYFSLLVTNTRDSYKVDQAFYSAVLNRNFSVNDPITIPEYIQLEDNNKKKCHSMNVELNFNPQFTMLDTTSGIYLEAKENGLTATTNVNGGQYVNYLKFHVDAEESREIKFFKKDPSIDYSYSGGDDEFSIIEVIDLDAEDE